MASLRIISGLNSGQSFELQDSECTIGREPWCQVRLNSRTVSRTHACISRQADGFFIEDLHSVNGTSVNGRRIDRLTRLDNGDRVQIFDIVLLFQINSPAASDRPPAAPVEHPPQEAAHENKIVSQIDVHVHGSELRTTESEKKLGAILRIAHSLGTSLEVDEILVRILDTLFDLFPQANMGYILQTATGGGLTLTVVKSRGDASDTLNPISLTIARRVMTEGLAFLTATGSADANEEQGSSIFEEDVRSIMCAPLVGPSRTAMGVIELVSIEPGKPFLPVDLEVLSTVALLAGQAVESARLHESLLQVDGRRREIAMAKSVQLQFLPHAVPTIPGYTFFHHYAAADSVAGDYYDYIPLPDGRWGIAVGDVSGKGISAALLMARLCSDVRFCLLTNPSPAEAVHKLNHQVCSHSKGESFITLVLFLLDPVANELTVVNAGHPLPLLKKGAAPSCSIIPLSDVSIPLGVQSSASFVQRTLHLDPGDVVLAYTDGVSDANNPDGLLYGITPIEEVVTKTKPVPTYVGRALLADLREFAKGHHQSDDICIVTFGRNAT